MKTNYGNFWLNAPIHAGAGYWLLGPYGALIGLTISLGALWWARFHFKRYVRAYPGAYPAPFYEHGIIEPKATDQLVYSLVGWGMALIAIFFTGPLIGFFGLLVIFGATYAGRPKWRIQPLPPSPELKGEFGDARSATIDEAVEHDLAEGDGGGFWVGQGLSYVGELGAVIVGASGTSKFASAIAITLLTCLDSAFVYDPKGQITAVTMAWRKAMGQIVDVMNPFGVWKKILGPSISYNILADLDPLDQFFETMVEEICLILIPYNPEEKTQHFASNARAIIGAFIMHLRVTRGPGVTLCDVNDALQQTAPKIDQELEEMLKSPVTAVQHIARQFHRELALESNRDVVQTMKDNMRFLGHGVIRRWFAHSDYTFKDFKKKKARTLYFVMPADDAASYPKAIQLVLSVATRTLIKPPFRPVIGIFDEVATSMPKEQGGGACPDIIRRAYGLARENGFRLQTVFQDIEQMGNFFKCGDADLKNSVFGNSGMIQFFGAGPADLTSAKWACEQAGDTTIWTPTRDSLWDDAPGDLRPRRRIADAYEASGGNAAGTRLKHPNDFRAMTGDGTQMVLLSGMKHALFTKRMPQYFDIPTTKKRSSFDPHHERQEWKKDSAAATAKEYIRLLQHAAVDAHATECSACHGKVRPVPLTVADWDDLPVGVCDNCDMQVVLEDGKIWVWKIRLEGGLQYGVSWHV